MPGMPMARSRYDVGTGKMVRGPQGAYKPLAGIVKATTGAIPLKRFPVEVRDGAIWLVG
jgi:nitrite reductase/ring-hydroxylating ferredoxin subunit